MAWTPVDVRGGLGPGSSAARVGCGDGKNGFTLSESTDFDFGPWPARALGRVPARVRWDRACEGQGCWGILSAMACLRKLC